MWLSTQLAEVPSLLRCSSRGRRETQCGRQSHAPITLITASGSPATGSLWPADIGAGGAAMHSGDREQDPGESRKLDAAWSIAGSKRRRMPRIRFLISAVVGLLILGGGAALAYSGGVSRGYARGESTGYSNGQREGYAEGKTEGYSTGREVGYEDGRSSGYDEGHSSGYAEGRLYGYRKGLKDGASRGYAAGYSTGSSGAYSRGLSEGCNSVFRALGDTTAAAWSDVDGLGYDPSFVSTVSQFSC